MIQKLLQDMAGAREVPQLDADVKPRQREQCGAIQSGRHSFVTPGARSLKGYAEFSQRLDTTGKERRITASPQECELLLFPFAEEPRHCRHVWLDMTRPPSLRNSVIAGSGNG